MRHRQPATISIAAEGSQSLTCSSVRFAVAMIDDWRQFSWLVVHNIWSTTIWQNLDQSTAIMTICKIGTLCAIDIDALYKGTHYQYSVVPRKVTFKVTTRLCCFRSAAVRAKRKLQTAPRSELKTEHHSVFSLATLDTKNALRFRVKGRIEKFALSVSIVFDVFDYKAFLAELGNTQ